MRRKRKKDYQKKNLKNPFFSHKEKTGESSFPKFRFFLVLIIFLAGLLFFTNSEYFTIKEISISGNDRISDAEIRGVIEDSLDKRRFLFFKQGNIFLFNKKQTTDRLAQNYLLDSVKIDKKLFDTLDIIITEKANGVIWAVSDEQYYLDLEGFATRQLDETDLVIEKINEGTDVIRPEAASGTYPLIYDKSNTVVGLGEIVTSSELVDFITNFSEELRSGSDFEVSHYIIDKPFYPEITMITKEGWEVRLKIGDETSRLVRVLNSLLQQKVKDRANLEYIDLRFGEKVFYK